MAFTSFTFLLFVVGVVVLYYIFPKKVRWLVLLATSCFYYIVTTDWRYFCVVLFTALISWLSSLGLQKLTDRYAALVKGAENPEQKKALRAQGTLKKRWLLALILVADFGILCFFKYDAATGSVMAKALNGIIRVFSGSTENIFINIAAPLGISFYTFQTTGYLIDVYRGRQAAERNPLKFLLFVTYFPQIVQGPISRYNQLAPQLFEGHSLKFDNLKKGIVLIGCGFISKLVLADRLYVLVNKVFSDYSSYGGAMIFLAAAFYGLQVYTDFAGGMLITTGVAQMMGIEMTENFRQPYLAISISDFWRRWHITLGAWMRDYLFYPLSLSKPFGKLGKWSRKKYGPRWSKIFVSSIVSLIVFTVVGIWHGSEAKYVVYGFYNGLLIMLATLCEPLFEVLFQKLHINPDGKPWHVVRVVRTFLLVSVGRCIVRSLNVGAAFSSLGRMITRPDFGQLASIKSVGYTNLDLAIILGTLILVAVADWLGEYHGGAYAWLQKRNIVIRWIVYLGIIAILVLLIPVVINNDGFLYARF